jgi:hypothetical protein
MIAQRQYAAEGAFRTALQARLNERARRDEVDLHRLRRQVASNRLLARMFEPSPPMHDGWILNGGYALRMRFLEEQARCHLPDDSASTLRTTYSTESVDPRPISVSICPSKPSNFVLLNIEQTAAPPAGIVEARLAAGVRLDEREALSSEFARAWIRQRRNGGSCGHSATSYDASQMCSSRPSPQHRSTGYTLQSAILRIDF